MKKILGLIGIVLTFALICAFATGCKDNNNTTDPQIPGIGTTDASTTDTTDTGATTDTNGSTSDTSSTSGNTTADTKNSTTGTTATTTKTDATTKPTTSTTKPATTTTGSTAVAPEDLVIFLDPGHGGSDPGTNRTYDGVLYKESEINLTVALKAKAKLEALGYKVVLSRTDDTAVDVNERAGMALEAKANMFISIHVNATTGDVAHGFEAFYSGKDGLKYDAKAFADLFTKQFEEIKDVKMTDDPSKLAYPNMHIRGTKADTELYTNGLAVLNRKESYMPSTLLELGFISNDSDFLMLKSQWWQGYAAQAIADAVVEAHVAGIYKK